MADDLGLSAGAKGISEGLKTGREAGREIGKNIEDVQKEAVDVAKDRVNAKIRERREAEFKKERAIFKALEEYKHRKKISEEEYQLRIDFIKKYGTKEWQKLIDIKTEIERLEKEDKKYFDAELSKVRWVQFWCFLAAGWIAYFIVWGSKR
jgi:translation initiation factor 2 alpha subunit (eIF-2alpha)